MGLIELREILAKLIKGSDAFDHVLALGNVVYVEVDDAEYEVVLRTVRPNMTKPITNPDD